MRSKALFYSPFQVAAHNARLRTKRACIWHSIAAVKLLTLMLLFANAVSGAEPAKGQAVPAFDIRIQVISTGRAQPAPTMFSFSAVALAHGQTKVVLTAGTERVVRSQDSQWSGWLNFNPASLATLPPVHPASASLPTVVKVYLGHVTNPATGVSNPAIVEAELRFESSGQITKLHAELFGPVMGVVVWRDESGQPHAATMADYNRRYWATLDGINLGPSERPNKFTIVDRFIGGDDDSRDWHDGLAALARIGVNTLAMPPQPELHELLRNAGVRKASGAIYVPPGGVLGLAPAISDEAIQSWAHQEAASYVKAGYKVRDVGIFALSDEPGWYYPASLRLLSANPAALNRFRDYLKDQGLSPADVEARNWSEVEPTGDSFLLSPATSSRLGLRRRYYWTMRFFSWLSAQHYAASTRALQREFYPDLPIFTNWGWPSGRFYEPGPFGKNPDPNAPDVASASQDWFEFARLHGGTFLWTEDWLHAQQLYQWSFYGAKLRSAAQQSGLQFGGYIVVRAGAERRGGLLQRVLSVIGAGGKAIYYYVFGPEYNFSENCYSERPEALREIAQVNRTIAAAEDLLWEGHPLPAQAAILAPRSAQLWDVLDIPAAAHANIITDPTNSKTNAFTVDYMAEVFDLYLALQHSDIPADFVDEDALSSAGGLKPYRTLYITEPDIPIEGQRGIVQWVRAGGTLVMVSGAGAKDRYDEHRGILGQFAGINEEPYTRLAIRSLPELRSVGVIGAGGGQVTVFGARSRISAPGTRVLARFDDGTPAMVERDVGLGHVIDFSWFPGLSYVHSRDIFPGGFPEEIRRLIIYPTVVGGVRPPVRVSAPMVETPVLLSPAGAAVVLLNWRDKPVQRLALTVQLPFAVSKVRSVMHGAIPFQRQGNSVICVLPVDTADVLSLRP